MSYNEPSWALMSTHDHLWGLRSTDWHLGAVEIMNSWCHNKFFGAYAYSLNPGTMIMSDHERSWGLIWAQECPWELISNHKCSWRQGTMLMSAQGWSWAIISIHEHSRALISGHKHSLSWSHSVTKLMSIHGHSAMVLWTLIAPWALMAPYSWCSWVLMSIHECSWVPMSGQ